MDSYDVLVIILSVSLAVFLILSIIAVSLLIQILKRVRGATETAQQAAENVEEFTSSLKDAGKATAAGSFISNISKIFRKEK